MKEFLQNFRSVIQKHWDEQTVSPKFLPIDSTRPLSLGQCAPTSQVLLAKLRQEFPERHFTLAIGEVRRSKEAIIPYHVWVVEIAQSPKENKIVDVTADQSEVLDKIVYEAIRDLAGRNIYYIAYQQSRSERFIHERASQRAAILMARLASND